MLVASNGALGFAPVPSAVASAIAALALAWIVERRVPTEDDDEDEITMETKLDVAQHE